MLHEIESLQAALAQERSRSSRRQRALEDARVALVEARTASEAQARSLEKLQTLLDREIALRVESERARDEAQRRLQAGEVAVAASERKLETMGRELGLERRMASERGERLEAITAQLRAALTREAVSCPPPGADGRHAARTLRRVSDRLRDYYNAVALGQREHAAGFWVDAPSGLGRSIERVADVVLHGVEADESASTPDRVTVSAEISARVNGSEPERWTAQIDMQCQDGDWKILAQRSFESP